MEELEWSQDFPNYNPMGDICCHGNQIQSCPKPNAVNPHPNDAPDKFWSW